MSRRERKPEIEYITPLTQFRISFLASLGHDCKLVAQRENRMSDIFLVDGERIRRINFFRYAEQRHKILRHHEDMFYNIGK